MNEDFVTYELAVKLKEKGFREECFKRYYCSDKAYFETNSYNPNTESVFYCYNDDEDLGRFYTDAPTISQVLKWLREEKIDVIIRPIFVNGKREYTTEIYAPKYNKPYYIGNVSEWKKSAITGIKYVLDNLI